MSTINSPEQDLKMATKETTNTNAHFAILQALVSCARVCDETASELRSLKNSNLDTIINTNMGCAETCRRGIYLLNSGSESSASFLEVCEEICRMCEEENNNFKIDACITAAISCHNCWLLLASVDPTV
jgi:hypothetical protein